MQSHLSYRVSYYFLTDDARFSELVDELEKNRSGFESLMLFTATTHSVVSLDVMRSRGAVLKQRISELKSHGWEVGIDLLCAVGFFKEFREAIPAGFINYTMMNGEVNQGAFCPNHEKYRQEYLAPLLQLLVATVPDFIWLDADSCRPACWCDHCLHLFNRRQGTDHSRDQLHAAFNAGTLEKRLELRQAHLDFATETNRELLSFVEKTVHELNREIGLGTMTYNDRLDTAQLPDALAGNTQCQVLWRPGGGAWNDQSMDDFVLRKGGNLANDCAWLPDRVDQIQAEVESFNYQPLQKSIHSTVMESCIYTAAGCNGVTFNLFDGLEPLEPHKPLMAALTGVRPFLEQLTVANGRLRPLGIYNGWTPRRNAARALDGGDWMDSGSWEDTNANDFSAAETATRGAQIFIAGLPPAYRLSEAQATILCSDVAWSLSEQELRAILAIGLYCDVKTLQILHRRGLGHLTGFRAVKAFDRDVRERLLPHPLNGVGAGSIRDGRQAFVRGYPGWQLECLDGKGEALAELIDYHNRVVADCSMGTYENDLGGRVVVAGYFATRHLLFKSKLLQIKNIFRWLSRDTLAAYIASFHRIALWVRSPGANGCESVVSLINASMDRANNVELFVHGNGTDARLAGMAGDCIQLTGIPQEMNYVRFLIPALAPWSVYSLEIERQK
jgi:hypothetical protein